MAGWPPLSGLQQGPRSRLVLEPCVRWLPLLAATVALLPTPTQAVVLTAESDWTSMLNQAGGTPTVARGLQGFEIPAPAPTKGAAVEQCFGPGACGTWGALGSAPARHHRPLPLHFHVGHGRHGPFFEDGAGPAHVTALAGDTAHLDCRVGLLHGKTVTWLHRRGFSLHLLTVGTVQYSADERVRLVFRYPSNWRLEIERVALKDEGVYECQVATHPPRARQVFLKVTAPELRVLDEGGRPVHERYYKAGSALELRCMAAGGADGEKPSWRRADADGRLAPGVSVNVSTLVTGGSVAALRVARAQKHHSGNYTCFLGTITSAAVAVHVLNGEEPAAVQHGGGAEHRTRCCCCSPCLAAALTLVLWSWLQPATRLR